MLEIICSLTLLLVVLLVWGANVQAHNTRQYFMELSRSSPNNAAQMLEKIDERLRDLQERLMEIEEKIEDFSQCLQGLVAAFVESHFAPGCTLQMTGWGGKLATRQRPQK